MKSRFSLRRASLVAQTAKESAYNAGDLSSIPGSGGSLGFCASILAWRIPWTEGAWRLQSMGVIKESDFSLRKSYGTFVAGDI